MGRRDIVRIQEEGHTVLGLLAGSPLGSEQLLFSREEQVPPSHTTPFAWTCFPVPTLPFSAPHLNAMPFYLNTRFSPIIKSKGKISALNQIVCRSLSAPNNKEAPPQKPPSRCDLPELHNHEPNRPSLVEFSAQDRQKPHRKQTETKCNSR